jgi:hypothetical protein
MKPIEESTVIRRPIEDVFDHIDVLANHESVNDHYLVDWELWGPATGVGATVRMRAKAPGRSEWVQLSVIEAERPQRRGDGRRRGPPPYARRVHARRARPGDHRGPLHAHAGRDAGPGAVAVAAQPDMAPRSDPASA